MRLRVVLALVVLGLGTLPSSAQQGSPREMRTLATEEMLDGQGDGSLRAYIDEHLAPAYRDGFEDEVELLVHLRELRRAVAPIGELGMTVDAEGRVQLHVSNGRATSVVGITLESTEPFRIVDLVLDSSEAREAGPRLTWDTLESALEAAAEEGFCGSVLAVRGGEIVLDRGFGFADPERAHAVTPQTLFAIGSTPIDFTHGAILLLEQEGKLSLDDPIGTYFDDVPADKRGITLEHLRTGRSGLLDFPGIPGVDANLDLSWVDRDEFMRRIFASQLRFEPGTENEHSHSAWGVLAAIVEIVSGQDYETFVRENFFEPAGMQRTGHFPLASRFPAEQVAVGLGGNVWGDVNAPSHWGETSWLVLGSGGMISTPGDLYRWRQFLASGDVLGPAAQSRYGLHGASLFEGGNDRGFVNTIGARGGDLVIVCSNSQVGMDDLTMRIAMAAARVGLGG